MIRLIKLSIPLAALTLLVAGGGPAWADPTNAPGQQKTKVKRSAPEFDPAAAGAVAALLAGGGVLLARRRRR